MAGVARRRQLGAACAVLLPGDCPLLEPRELERLLTGLPERYAAIVPDRHGTGTNALALAPPDAIRPAFGKGSCARHVAIARAAGVPYAVEELPSLALDLDTPADVVALTMALERTAAAPAAPQERWAYEPPKPSGAPCPGICRKRTTGMSELRVLPVDGLPEIGAGDPLGELIAARAELRDGDVIVVSQKVVSKAEGRVRKLASVIPGAEARKLAAVLGKEPALVQLVLGESAEVLRAERGVLIVETHHGFVCANAGIDTSNLPEDDTACLLPEDPDASARRIRSELEAVVVAGAGGGGLRTKAGSVRRPPPPAPPARRRRDCRQLRPRVEARPEPR